MRDLPEDVRRIIAHAASLNGALQFGGSFSNWEALSEWEDTPCQAGLYMLGLKLGIRYERDVSRIAYIGSTRNLRTRTQSHNANSHNYRIEQLKSRYPGALLVTSTALPGLSLDWLRALEDAAVQEAERQFGLYPICNQGRIDSPKAKCCSGLVRVFPCDGLPFPITVKTLCRQLGSNALGRLPDPVPSEYWAAKPRTSTTVEICFAASTEPIDDVPDEKAPVENRDPPTSITDENVATWTVLKMRRLIQICATLTPVPRTSKVRTFATPSCRVPRPHTWGEVALVQARIVAGVWFPKERLWIKIVCEKELLGQAILEPDYYRGEDKSDVPQIRKRPSIWESKHWCEEAETIRGELPADYVPQVYEIAELPQADSDDPVTVEHLRLLSASRAFDLEQACRNADFDRQHAIDHDKDRRLVKLLNSRIEARFLEASQLTD